MKPRNIRRLLTSVASHSSSPSPSPFIPPYSHQIKSALKPPYNHQIDKSKKIAAPYGYKLVENNHIDEYEIWAKEKISTEYLDEWKGSIDALRDTVEIPEYNYQESSSASLGNGAVVIRDVISDNLAQRWARDILEATIERDGHPVYWHEALLSARSNPSILSALSRLYANEELYISAEPISTTITTTPSINEGIIAHLALMPTTINIANSLSSSLYSRLHPLMRPKRSRISYYNQNDYLNLDNWEQSPTIDFSELPHLSYTTMELSPGDLIVRRNDIPAMNEEETLVLPLRSIGKEEVMKQKEAFEKGLPPPRSNVEGMVMVEREGGVDMIDSSVGRRVMGY